MTIKYLLLVPQRGSDFGITNKELIKVLKVLYRKLRQTYTIQWHWIKGHMQFWGNDRADELANKGTTGKQCRHQEDWKKIEKTHPKKKNR